MGVLFANNATSKLASGISAGDTSITVSTGDGALFPAAGSGNYFYATLEDASGNIEIVKCTSRATDVLTVTRAQQGTTAMAFSADTGIGLRVTRDTLIEYIQSLVSADWVVGPTPTFVNSSTFTLTGDQTATMLVGRRVEIVDAGGTKYGTILSSAFTSLTTVVLDADSDALASPLSTLRFGQITPNNTTSLPLLADTVALRGGSSDRTKKLRIELDGLTTAITRVWTATDYDCRVSNMPAGIIVPYGGAVAPTGWLPCDGAAVSRTTYAALFTAISTTYGSGDGSTTFNVPDFRGRTIIGSGTGTNVESIDAANVSVANDTFTVVSNTDRWITGMAVVYTQGGALTGLTTSTTYYIIRDTATTVKLATTLANAQDGTAIDFSGTPSGTYTLTATLTARSSGKIGGEEAHAQSASELYRHRHSVATTNNVTDGPVQQNTWVVGSGNNTGFTGGNQAMNIMPPYGVALCIISY